ncbi:DUF6668 family protein [Acidipropionibacterium timonense]|uniref:DUF6668 family protein n=1 Tax=Acidipropionibacterium timonense TaxID=2161818 RepID=UPI0010327401|nr:DUF6668 family protein [Acidipropionibacterium timonense]
MNPWVTVADEPAPALVEVERGSQVTWTSQPGVPAPADPLGHRGVWSGGLWVLGAHGGAGESTVAAMTRWRPAGHLWPVAVGALARPAVLVVARSNAHGLEAARAAACQWAAGDLACDLAGLLVIADAPGRLPVPLRHLRDVVAGTYPHAWHMPWLPPLRLGQPCPAPPVVGQIARTLDERTA